MTLLNLLDPLSQINTNSVGLPKRSRGRGRGPLGRPGFSSQLNSMDPAGSDENEDDEENEDGEGESNGNSQPDANETKRADSSELLVRLSLAEQHGLNGTQMDPRPGYIRWLSSSRLTPSNRICIGPGSLSTDLFVEQRDTARQITGTMFCALGCGRARRYTCSATGQPVCSLLCYKKSMNDWTKTNLTKQPCT
ncbi:unnamed protein product [Echinostoma caproni]|uniref:HIT-type domain-containing protein n=1 Tax=Echinostoma caproni TaxID=27848 RepID=A0A183A0F9_9TREM|nr:unnamed protein product [Echinostoma caproni]